MLPLLDAAQSVFMSKAVTLSKSPRRSQGSESDSKVLTPTRKAPVIYDDTENTEPDELDCITSTRSQQWLRSRRSSAASYCVDQTVTKILTPKVFFGAAMMCLSTF